MKNPKQIKTMAKEILELAQEGLTCEDYELPQYLEVIKTRAEKIIALLEEE